MAELTVDAEFWLPAKFLTDDDISVEKENLKNKNGGENDTGLLIPSHDGFPDDFPYEFDSFDSFCARSSPVESVVGSAETESSDEDVFRTGLSRRLALSTSQKLTVPSLSLEKHGALASSPQSILSGLGSSSASSNGGSSPNGPSQVPSPPTTPFGAQIDTWDLIYAAASQVAKLKISNEVPKSTIFNHGRCLPKSQNHGFMKNSSFGLYSNQSQSHNLAQTNYYNGRQESVKASHWQAQLQQQQQQQQIQSRLRGNFVGLRPLGLPQPSWPPVQVQPQLPPLQPLQLQPQQKSGSGMTAMFHGGSGSVKRECAGTGVFLPRRCYGKKPHEPRKKSGCSTVLLPAEAVQALHLNLDDPNRHVQPRFDSSFASNYDALVARRNALLRQAGRNYRSEGGLNLPQEWTY